jgi:cation transport regulator
MATLTMTELPMNLPEAARKIYQQAYDSAWNRYQLRQRRDNSSREEVAHRLALTAVQEKFQETEKGWRAL